MAEPLPEWSYRVAIDYPNLARVIVEVPMYGADCQYTEAEMASKCAEWAWKQDGVQEVIRQDARVLIVMKPSV